jgi:glycosyltransferase involved in cell wall biosynthesis
VVSQDEPPTADPGEPPRRGCLAFRACLVGGGERLEAHRRLARDLGLADRVALPGQVPNAFAYLARALVFVLPTLEEGSGSIALIEALQAGLAIVASRIDGIPEDVDNGDSALLVSPGDTAALGQALRRVLTDPGLRACLARRAREAFAERFSPAAFVRELGQAYGELGFCP